MSNVLIELFVENYEEKFRATDGQCSGVGYTEDEARKALADAVADSMRKPVSITTKPTTPEAA